MDKDRVVTRNGVRELKTGLELEKAKRTNRYTSHSLRVGFVVSLKNIKLLQKPKSTIYTVNIKVDYKMQDLKYLSFNILKNDIPLAKGSLVIALQEASINLTW